jgi:hypothetical protein
MKFEGIRIVQILIQGSNNKPTILKLSSIKYCLFIGTFNFVWYPNSLRKDLGLQ